MQAPEIAYFCVIPRKAGTLRLIATGSLSNPPTPVTNADVAVSDPIQVTRFYELGPSASAAAAGFGGFLLGLLTFGVQRGIDQWSDRAKTRRALEKSTVELLGGELSRNREIVAGIIERQQPPAALETGAYNNLSNEVLSFLKTGQRKRYLKAIDSLYSGPIADYNNAVTTNNTEKAAADAERVLDALGELSRS